MEGLQQSAIARLETGRSENVGIKTLYEIAVAIGTPLSEIISQAEGNRKKEKLPHEDDWSQLEQTIMLLSAPKRKWLASIVETIVSGPK